MSWPCALASLLLAAHGAAGAAAAPCAEDGRSLPGIRLEPVAEGLRAPVHLTHAGDGTGRLFVVEQAGRVRIVKGGRLLAAPFLDIRGRVASGGEKGLLSVAFHPRYRENGRFFVHYTSSRGGLHSVVSEFKAGKDPDRADAGSERALLTLSQPYSNHNGGQNAFGPDGLLYIGFGDGGSANDPHGNGQRLDTWLGKILRIGVDGKEPYSIPADNPFAAGGGLPEIYAWGLRNPWRFSFDPVTRRLWAGDVGQNAWEEVDLVEKGGNYGWRPMEGFRCTPGVEDRCEPKAYAPPVHAYGRGDGISVTGGFVYRGRRIPELCGAYVFGDYGSGRIWGLRLDAKGRRAASHRLLKASRLALTSFGEGADLELYAVEHGGSVLRLAAE